MTRLGLVAAVFALLAAPPAPAQEPGRVYRIGVLSPAAGALEAIRRITLPELAKLGFVEGRNLVVEERSSDGSPERLARHARELAALNLDAFLAVGNPVIAALKQAAPRTPIVMSFGGDGPIAAGFVETLARPGGLITGTSMLGTAGDSKRLQLLHDAVPKLRRFGFLTPDGAVDEERRRRLAADAAALGVEVVVVGAQGSEDYRRAIAELRARGAEAVAIAAYPVFARDATELADLLGAAGLPTICEWREMVREGCLLSYGPNNRELRRRAAHFLARILRGQAPGEIPVEEPSVYELAVNLQTARRLGIELPAEILARAEDVVD